MKELDFLPQWYREGQRRQSHMRTQYAALVIVFFAMMTFNVTATHRASRAAAELTRFDGQRLSADGVIYEFSQITRQLGQLKTKADLLARIDSRIDVAAVLAELSHLIGASIVLNRVELVAEPFQQALQKEEGKGPIVRTVGTPANPEKTSLDQVKFRVVVAGVAADPAQVADLVCKLDESAYFQHVHPSFSRDTKIQIGTDSASTPEADKTATKRTETLAVTEFEITCYLANYEELRK